jgi:Adaptin N terminal region
VYIDVLAHCVLCRYASEVDVDFVRKAVRSIGRLAIKISLAADRCIKALLELVSTKVNYVVQEAIVVIKDIFRRYPNQYERIIATLCENLDALDTSEAKAAMIWIIGQYADRIENSEELLEDFLEGFLDETVDVRKNRPRIFILLCFAWWTEANMAYRSNSRSSRRRSNYLSKGRRRVRTSYPKS